MNTPHESMHATDAPSAERREAPQAPPPADPTSGWGAERALHRLRSMPFDPRRKSPILAAFLSVLPGLGQVYVGYYQRGFAHILILASVFAMAVNGVVRGAEPLFVLFIIFFWFYNVIDAGRRAALYNYAMASGEAPSMPDTPLERPGLGGSLIGGILLIVAGGVLLSNTLFEVPLDWVERWWPMAPILFGAYLLVRWLQERSGQADRGAAAS